LVKNNYGHETQELGKPGTLREKMDFIITLGCGDESKGKGNGSKRYNVKGENTVRGKEVKQPPTSNAIG